MPDVTIINTARVPAVTKERVGKFERVVVYQVDGGEQLLLIIPDETATRATIEAEICKDVAARGLLVGHTFKLP